MKKEKLERRQYRYKEGSVVKFTDKFLNDYWRGRDYKKGDIGIVTHTYGNDDWRKYQVEITVYRNNTPFETKKSVYKGRDVHLLTYNDAMVESL